MAIDKRKLLLAAGGVGAGLVAAKALRKRGDGNASVVAAITIDRSRSEIFAALQDAGIVERCFEERAGVHCTVQRESEIVSWDADGQNVLIALKDAPGERGTELHATTHHRSQEYVKAILRRFKALVETGEIATGERTR